MRQIPTALSRTLLTAMLGLGGTSVLAAVDFNFCYNPDTNCKNKEGYCEVCCIDDPSENAPANAQVIDCDKSFVDNSAWSHYHMAVDYRAGLPGTDGGCSPCGGVTGASLPGALPGLELQRIHQYRWLANRSSFGPGVFSTYDISLELSTVGQSWTNYGKQSVRLINPSTTMFSINMYDHDWTQADFTTTPVLSRVDSTVDFDWGAGSPGTGVPADGFAARWSGTVIPTATESYTFYTSTDDGIRLWVNGTLVIDKWNHQSATEHTSTPVALTAGVPVTIRLEMYEQGGDASAKLSWSSASTTKAIIPSSALRTAASNPGLDTIFVTSYGATDGIYRDNDPYGGRTKSQLGELKLLNSGGTVTSDQSQAVTATLKTLDGDTLTFQVFRTDTNSSTTERVARLISKVDRNGNGITLSYVYPVTTNPASAGGDLQKLWMIDDITDAYGRAASVTYKSTQVAGRWVVERIDLPNGKHIDYAYGNAGVSGAGESTIIGLSQITHPDTTTSTFSTSISTQTQCQVVHYDDAAADTTHRRKNAHLTLSSWTDPVTSVVTAQPFGRLRALVNGAGEIAWMSKQWIQSNNTHSFLIFMGGNELVRFDFSTDWDGKVRKVFHATSWNQANDPSTYTWEASNAGDATYDNFYRLTSKKDALNRQTSYQVDLVTGNVTGKTYPDGSTSSTTYTAYRQPVVETDRLNRITKHVYSGDGKSNLLEKTTAFGVSEEATWKFAYNARGQVTYAYDANYVSGSQHVTQYVYNTAGYLISIIEPADGTSGAEADRATRYFEYDSGASTGPGLLTKVSYAKSTGGSIVRNVRYEYDDRNRLKKTLYDDNSVEEMTYWTTGGKANLVKTRSDRNGNVTTYDYDAHGRLTTKVEASNDSAIAATSTYTYLTGTNDEIATQTVVGDTTTNGYDFRNRLVTVSHVPRTTTPAVTLTTTTSYDTAQRVAWVQDPYGRKTYRVYDVNDRVIRLVEELIPGAIAGGTNLTTLTRITTANPSYVILERTYDAEGQQLTDVDGRGITRKFVYDKQGRLIEDTQAYAVPVGSPVPALGYKTVYEYDDEGNRTRIKHPRSFTESANFWTEMSYTGRNLLKSVTEATGRGADEATQTFTYTYTKKKSTVSDFLGRLTTYLYSTCCDRVVEVREPAPSGQPNPTTYYQYDSYGNITRVTDPNGHWTGTDYDRRHRVIKVTRDMVTTANPTAPALITEYKYDDNAADSSGLSSTYSSHLTGLGFGAGFDGSLVEVTNPESEKSVQIHDAVGRVIKTIDGLSHTTTTTFDTIVSNLVETTFTDALSHATKIQADGAGNPRVTIDALTKPTSRGFDANGNQVTIRDPNDVGMDCTFDAANREIKCLQTRTDVVTELESVYDAHGNRTQHTDAQDKTTTCYYDARDRKTSCVDRLTSAGTTSFEYDDNSNLKKIIDAEGKETRYDYDLRNLLVTEIYPKGDATSGTDENKRTYTYDAGRRLSTWVDQDTVTTAYQYDPANRLKERQYPDSQNDLFAYDKASRLLQATSKRFGTVVDRVYDDASRLTSETQTIAGYAFPVGYEYSNDNQVTKVTYPNTKQLVRTYTARHQLESVTFDGAAIASRTYDNGGRLSTTTYGATSAVESRAYVNKDLMPLTIQVSGVTNFSYTYDGNRRKTYEGHQFTDDYQTFAYDNEERLITWNRDGKDGQSWGGSTGSLSKVGDWVTTTRTQDNTFLYGQTRTHTDAHETTGITQTGAGAGTFTLTYDKRGNLTTDQQGQGYDWDRENRLVTAAVGAASSTYVYDALGRRLAKTAAGIVTTFVHDGAQVIAEYEAPLYQSSDIGSPTLAGSFSDPGTGTVTVAASGTDIWNTSDQFRYAYFTLKGDGSLTAKVTSQTNTDGWAKAGVMLRDSLAADAVHAMTCITPGNGAAFQRRQTTGGASTNNHTGGGTATAPYWVRITRAGTTVKGYCSANGLTWVEIANDTVTFSQQTIYAGLAVTSHTNGAVSTATFTNVSLTSAIGTTSSPAYARGYAYGAYVDEPLALLPASGLAADRKFYHANHLYSVAALTDNSGAVVERYRYDAYGQRTVLEANGTTVRAASAYGNQVGFTGRYQDKETGLWYFRARYYSAMLGGFVSRDPLKYVDGLCFYSAKFIPNDLDSTGMSVTLDATPPENHPYSYQEGLWRDGTRGSTSVRWQVKCPCTSCKCVKPEDGIEDKFEFNCTIVIRYSMKLDAVYGNGVTAIGGMTKASTYGHEQRHIKSHNEGAEAIRKAHVPNTGKCIYLTEELCKDSASKEAESIIAELKAHWAKESHAPGVTPNPGTPGPGEGYEPLGPVPQGAGERPDWDK